MSSLKWTVIPLTAGLLISGCSREARDQYAAAGERAGKAIATDAEKSKTAADNALETAKVKSALNSAAGLETKNIDVDSDTKVRTITLNGSVPDGKQKVQAETVAKGIAGGEFRVVNKLTVVPSSN